MTLESHLPSTQRSRLRSSGMRSLRELPPRRPERPSPRGSLVQWELVDLERYAVRRADETVGFIDVVGAVFVVLSGARYDRAVEVLQTLDFTTAICTLCPEADAEGQSPDTEMPLTTRS